MDERTKLLAQMAATLAASREDALDISPTGAAKVAAVAARILVAVEGEEERRQADEARKLEQQPKEPGAGTQAWDDARV
jgi:hypothetical protein